MSQKGLLDFEWDNEDFTFGEEVETEVKEVIENDNEENGETIEDIEVEKKKPASKKDIEEDDEEDDFDFGNQPSAKGFTTQVDYKNLYEEYKEKGIFKKLDLSEEDLDELDEEKFEELRELDIQLQVQDRLTTWANEDLDEDAKAFIAFKAKGGDTREFFESLQHSYDLPEGDLDDEAYQDNVIRYTLEQEGWDRDEIEDRIAYLTDNGTKRRFASKYDSRIEEERESIKKDLVSKAEQDSKIKAQNQEKFKTDLKNVLASNEEIKGFSIPEKEKGEILKYLTKREKVGKVEVTNFQRGLAEALKSPEKLVLLAKLLKSDFDTTSLEKKAGSKKVRQIKKEIEQRASTASKYGSSFEGNSLADLFIN